MIAIEVRDDTGGTDSLIAQAVRGFHRDDVELRGEEWRAEQETPYSLLLTQWREHDNDEPTGPRVRVTFAVHVEDVTA